MYIGRVRILWTKSSQFQVSFIFLTKIRQESQFKIICNLNYVCKPCVAGVFLNLTKKIDFGKIVGQT